MTQQEESAYCFRLVRLLIDIGSDVLRDVLLKTIHPYTLTMFVQNNINRIKYLKQRKLLFKDQYDLLTKSSAVQPAALDITLLCWIFRNLCNISPTKGWENPPGSTDQGLGDDIFRLQTFRNTIHGHITTTRVTAADFQTKWTELEELIIRLTKLGTPMIQQNTSVRISEIRFQDLDPESTRKIIEILNSWKKHEEMWETIKKKLEKQEEVLEIQGKRLGKQEEQLKKHGEKLEKQDKQLEKQAEQQGEQGKQLRRHGEQLDKDTKQLGHQKEQLKKHDKQLEKQDEQLEKQDEQLGIYDEHLEGHREQLQHQDERLRTVEHKVTGILEEQQHRNTLPTTEDEHLSESQVAPLIQQNVEGTNVQIENNNAMFLKHGLNLLDDEDETGFPSLPTRKTVQQLDTERRMIHVPMDMKVHSSLTYADDATKSTKQPKKSYSQVLQNFTAKKATVVNYIVQNTRQNTLPLSGEESQLNVFLYAVNGFKRGHFVLVTCGAQPDETIQNIGKVPWTVVFDFDPNSRAHGLLSQAEIPIKIKRSLHIKTWKDKSVITEQSTNWIFVQGTKDQPDTQTDEKFQKWKKQTQSGIENIIVQMDKFGKSYTNYCVVVMWPSNEKLSSHVKHLLDELENLGLCDFVIVVEKYGAASDVSETLFKQMQEDYEKKPTILRLSIKDVCLAINRVFLRSTSNRNTKFDLPALGPSYIGIIDEEAQWLKEDLEVLYGASPYSFEYSLDKLKEETDNFYRGGNWPWYMWYETGVGHVDVERAIMKDIIGSLKQNHIEAFKSGRVTICHAPGSGGTTLAQRILWELHKDTPCVQVKLRTGSSDVASRIQLVYEKTRLPILILLDGEDEQRVDLLARELRDIVFVILYVQRYTYPMEGKGEKSKSCFWLKRFVTRQESINIAHKFLQQCESETTKAAVKKLQCEVETGKSEHEIFEFGLATYKHHYKGVESYVNGFLQLEKNSVNELLPWQHALGILSLVCFYGQVAMPCKFFSKLLKYPLLMIDDFPSEMDALIVKDTNDGRANMVRISHYLVAKEILEQILSRPMTRGDRVAELCLTAKRKLEPFAVNFISLAAKSGLETSAGIIEKIMTRTFISRDNKAAGETDLVDRPRKFAQILHDVSSQPPYTERFRILEELLKSFPNEPQFLAHLGRLYSLCRPEDENFAEKCFVKALEICDKEIEGLVVDDITYSMRLTLMHIYHMYGNMFLTRVSKYTGKTFGDKPLRYVSDDKIKKTLDELFPMVQKACGYFSKCRYVTPTGSEESHGFLGEIKLRLMFCDFVFRRNGFDDIYKLIEKFEDSEMADFVEDTISKVDELVLECLSVVDPDKIEQELQYCQIWFASLFITHTPWNVVFRTQETVKSRRLQITARKLLYQKKKVYGVLEEVTNSSDIQFIVKNYEANFKDIHDNGIESPHKAIDLDYREWLFAIRHKHLRITYTLQDVLKQVRLWHEKVQTPNSRFYLFILCSLLGFQGNTELLIEAQQHKDDLLKQCKYVTKPKYPREMLGSGSDICCLTPGTRFFGLIEGREIKGNFNSDSVKVMIGTICGPNDKPAAGYIRLDLGQDHLIGVSVFFVPVRSDMKGPAYAGMRVEFYVGFSIAHGYEAYNVRQLKKMKCIKCGLYQEVRSKSHTKCRCGEVIKSE